MIERTISIRYQFPLSRDILLIRDSIIGISIPSSISLPISTLFLFPWYETPCDLVTCLQANRMSFHREGPEYIYPSFGWTNPTLDPCASTYTFRIPNATFITTQLRSSVWCHQSIPPVLVINMISWSKDEVTMHLRATAKWTLMTWSYAMLTMGVCPSHHSPNDMILLLITSNVHDHETMIIY